MILPFSGGLLLFATIVCNIPFGQLILYTTWMTCEYT